MPPRISSGGVLETIKGLVKNVGSSAGESALGAGTLGAIVGTLILPGLGTIIGAALAAILTFSFSKRLDQIKAEVFEELMDEFEIGVGQIRSVVVAWIEQSKKDLYNAYIDSFKRNSKKLAALLKSNKIPLKALPPARS